MQQVIVTHTLNFGLSHAGNNTFRELNLFDQLSHIIHQNPFLEHLRELLQVIGYLAAQKLVNLDPSDRNMVIGAFQKHASVITLIYNRAVFIPPEAVAYF